MTTEQNVLSGSVEQIGESANTRHLSNIGKRKTQVDNIECNDYPSAFKFILNLISTLCGDTGIIDAVSHRVVHGGTEFVSPTLLGGEVLDKLRSTISLAPLHNKASITGIELALEFFPQIPQIAVFDTTFHQTMPEYAYRYAVPHELYEHHQIRRYGFHGLSHAYVCRRVAVDLNQSNESLNIISLHLGNGASAAAISKGKCIDTSMGMTPMEGLIMGQRCGDLDPGVVFYLLQEGYTPSSLDNMLNRDSGLKGLCGSNDVREILTMVEAGNEKAKLALDMYCYRIKKYIGAYQAILGHIDAIVFTGGIGENSPQVRASICERLDHLGIILDSHRNTQAIDDILHIEASGNGFKNDTKIIVVRTDEANEIAVQTQHYLDQISEIT